MADPATYPVLNFSGTGAIVTRRSIFYQVGKTDAEQAHPLPQASRTMTILAPLASCSPLLSSFPPLDAVGGEGFVATVGDECAMTASTVRMRTPNATHTIPALPAPATSTFAPHISNLRVGGRCSPARDSHGRARLACYKLGRRRPRGDGRRAAARADRCPQPPNGARIRWHGWLLASWRSRLPRRRACARSPWERSFAPTPAVTSADRATSQWPADGLSTQPGIGYAVTDLQGAVHLLAEAPLLLAEAAPFAFDGRTVYAVRNDCDADRLLAVDGTCRDRNRPARCRSARCDAPGRGGCGSRATGG